MTEKSERHLKLEGTFNVRDLGGYACLGGGTTRWRAALRADGLHHMTPASIAALADMGVNTIIDLRGPLEFAVHPDPFDGHAAIRYHNIPLFDALAPVAEVKDDFDMAARYRDAVDLCGDRIAQVLTVIGDAPPGAVMFHCTAGKDRTGIVAALLLLCANVSDDLIVEDYALTATVAAPLLAEFRAAAIATGASAPAIERILACDADTMRSLLGHLQNTHGDLESFGRFIGMDRQAFGRLRERLAG